MSRTLTANASAEANKLTGSKPFNVLHIERTGADDLYLTDAPRTVAGITTLYSAVLNWSTIVQPTTTLGSQKSSSFPPYSDYACSLSLSDSTLRGIFLGNSPPINEKCTIYQFWDGLTWPTDAVILYVGTLGSIGGGKSQSFNDSNVSVTLNIIDYFKTLVDKDYGTIVTEDIFENLHESAEGAIIPLVYGKRKKVKGVMVVGPKQGVLMKKIDFDDTELYIENGDKFPQGAQLTIRIDDELIRGSFAGKVFTVTSRAYYIGDYSTAGNPDNDARLITLVDGPAIDNSIVGYAAGVSIGTKYQDGDLFAKYSISKRNWTSLSGTIQNNPRDGRQWRHITSYNATNGVMEIGTPYYREGVRTPTPSVIYSSGHQTLTGNLSVRIGTFADSHLAGAIVYEYLEDGYTYAFNNDASSELTALYFYGIKGEHVDAGDAISKALNLGGIYQYNNRRSTNITIGLPTRVGNVFQSEVKDYHSLPTSLYELNKDDNTWVANIGHNITTITLPMLTVWFDFYKPDGLDLWADLEGVTDDNTSTGTLITTFPNAIYDFLVNKLGISGANVDLTSFTDANTNTSEWLEVRGNIAKLVRGSTALSAMAFQCRSRIIFEAGKVYLKYLSNAIGTPTTPTIDTTVEYENGLTLSWEDAGEVTNELKYTWINDDLKTISEIAEDEDSITSYGRRSANLKFDFISKRDQAEQIAVFWLRRWSNAFRRGQVRCNLKALPFQREDVVTVDFDDWNLDSVPVEVTDIYHSPSTGGNVEEINVGIKLPIRIGCATSCELFCETGSESIAVTVCGDACETSCQVACQLFCQTVSETDVGCGSASCQIGDQLIGEPCVYTETSSFCDTAGCQSCQGVCVTGCQSGCETVCEPSYIVDSCSDSCEVAFCQTSCTGGGCETSCQASCTISGESGCSTLGDSDYECSPFTCQFSCTITCMSGCETDCETYDISNFCDSHCIVSGCESACQIGGCETSCESSEVSYPSCDLMCETNAMSLDCGLNSTAFPGGL